MKRKNTFLGMLIGAAMAACIIKKISDSSAGEDLFYNILAAAFGAAFANNIARDEPSTYMGWSKRYGPQAARMLGMGLYWYGFFWCITGMGPFGPSMEGIRFWSWVAGAALGFVLMHNATASRHTGRTQVADTIGDGFRMVLLEALLAYTTWIVVTRPSWWCEEQTRGYGGPYILGWHAILMLVMVSIYLFASWYLGFPEPEVRTRRVEGGPFRTNADPGLA